mgnify:FL=1
MVHENIEKIRIAKGITKTYMAKGLGLSLMGYIHMAKGNTSFPAERIKKAAAILQVDPGVFFDDKLTVAVIENIKRTLATDQPTVTEGRA